MMPTFIRRLRLLPAVALLGAGLLANADGGEAATPPEQEQLGRILPELAGALPLGLSGNGDWSGRVSGTEYVLQNRNATTSVYYGYLLQPEPAGQGLSVEVTLPRRPQTGLSGAGLLYGFAPDGPRYCAFVLHPDGVAGLYARDGEGFHPLQRIRLDSFRSNGSNTLRLTRSDTTVTAFVNGRQVLEFPAEKACPARSREEGGQAGTVLPGEAGESRAARYEGAGIIALSLGSFGFSDFALH